MSGLEKVLEDVTACPQAENADSVLITNYKFFENMYGRGSEAAKEAFKNYWLKGELTFSALLFCEMKIAEEQKIK